MDDRTIQSPSLVRVLPFAVFIGLTMFQDALGEEARYWIYFAKTIAAGLVLITVQRQIGEIQWRFNIWAVLAGVGVVAAWIGLDGLYPSTGQLYSQYICPLLAKVGLARNCAAAAPASPWNPNAAFGIGSTLALFFLVVRIVGSTLL